MLAPSSEEALVQESKRFAEADTAGNGCKETHSDAMLASMSGSADTSCIYTSFKIHRK